MQVEQLNIDQSKGELTLSFADNFQQILSFEFLRVYSPDEQTSVKGKPKPPVSHKKQVQLLAIEPVAKHGYRFIFDDQHNAIYSALLLNEYAHNKNRLWQQYVDALKLTGHSREAMIDIKQV